MVDDSYVMTLDSDDETIDQVPLRKKGKKRAAVEEVASPDDKDALNPEFTFDLTGDIYADVLGADTVLGDLVKGSKQVRSYPALQKLD